MSNEMSTTGENLEQETPQDVKDGSEGENQAEDDGFQWAAKKETNILTIWGNKQTMNLNHLVLENIVQSPYYKNKLSEMKMFHELIDEIYYNVQHLEPWEKGTRKTTGQTGMCGGVRGVGAGGVVSTPFCLMYRLFMLKLTRKQIYTLLNHPDSPFIRGVGFMYIRFCLPPSTFWDWYERYLEDEEPIDPRAGGGDPITIGQMVKMFLTKLEWYCTLFPRIPVPVQKELDLKMREHNKKVYEFLTENAEKTENLEEQESSGDKKRESASKGRSKSRERRQRSRSGSRRNGKDVEDIKRSYDRRENPSRSASRHGRSYHDDDRRQKRSRSPSPSTRHDRNGRQGGRGRSRSRDIKKSRDEADGSSGSRDHKKRDGRHSSRDRKSRDGGHRHHHRKHGYSGQRSRSRDRKEKRREGSKSRDQR